MSIAEKSPAAHVGASGASKENSQHDFTKIRDDKPPPCCFPAYVKNILVQLGVNGFLPRLLCTKLINLLGLRGE